VFEHVLHHLFPIWMAGQRLCQERKRRVRTDVAVFVFRNLPKGIDQVENRHGLAVAGKVTLPNGTAERRASEAKAKKAGRRITVGEDKAYDTADHVANLHAINVTPHVTQNDSITSTGERRQSAIDRRTTRHEGYGLSQSRRAMTECIFGWGKQHGTMRKTKHRGIASVAVDFMLKLIAYNLIRIPKLLAA
jgi:hypothetical protein